MTILLWLLPAVLVTAGAMCVAGLAQRERPLSDRASDQAQERFARAIQRPLPVQAAPRPRQVRMRSTGIAVRPSRPAPTSGARPAADATRRSA